MDVDEAVAELYGAALPDFVTVRSRLVGRAKGEDPALAKEIGALRKPSAAAWLLNQVARRSPEALEVVQHVGHRMRAATAAGDTAALRGLRGDRDGAIAAVLEAAAEVAAQEERPWSGGVQDEVRGTVVAALASEESTEALASGALLRALSYAGFGEVTLDDAVAARLDRLRRPAATTPEPATPVEPAGDDEEDEEDEEDDVEGEEDDAEGGAATEEAVNPSPEDEAVDEAERALAAARLHAEEAHEEHAATRRRAKDLRGLLATAREEEAAAHARVEEADDAVADARAELARLTRRR